MREKKVKSEFAFSLSQKRGIFVLLFLICALLVILALISSNSSTKQVDFSDFQKEIALYQQNIIKEEALKENIKLAPFKFNPNTLTVNEGLKLGLKEHQIKNIHNYLSKGGHFYKKEDLEKMYSISKYEYEILEPYIYIPNNNTVIKKNTIDLNLADTTDLKSLKGIGSIFANRIIKYRNLLGGFYTKHQLLEVYNFTPKIFEEINGRVTVNTENIRKININKASLEQLTKHPYINYSTAKSIIEYRYEKGSFESVDDLLKMNSLEGSVFEKIKPYLIVQ